MKTGTSTGTVYVSPARARRWAKKQRREEREWAARSGPVTVTYREILPDDREILPRLENRPRTACAAAPRPAKMGAYPDQVNYTPYRPVGHRQNRPRS